MTEEEIKKAFIKSLCTFMQKAITENSSGTVKGEDIIKISPRGASITCNLPENFFRNTTINPTTIKIKFEVA